MNSVYHPTTTEVVKDAVTFPRERLGEPRTIKPEAFDRWLSAEIRKAKAEALRDAATVMRTCKQPGHWNLMNQGDPEHSMSPDVWIECRAAELENGEER